MDIEKFKEVAEKIKDIKDIEESVLEVESLYKQILNSFSSKARAIIEDENKQIKSTLLNVVLPNGDVKTYACQFFAANVDDTKKEKLIFKVTQAFNDLCDRDMVLGILAPPSSIKLANYNDVFHLLNPDVEPWPPRTGIFFFVFLNDDGLIYAKENYSDLLTVEGSIGTHIDFNG
ncbi:MAG: hypothetical protein KGO96_07615 [Elusimicrobia bacterium]|nr:hypothetical protein [Elusimicrobiota bacterium]